MGMSHELCDHPRTPAGRAACRKAGGPGTAITAPKGAPTPSQPRQRVAKAATTPVAPVTTPTVRRTVSGVLADLPRVFRAAADWATSNSCLVTTSTVKDQQMVHLTNEVGRVTLTWRPATPDGVWAVSFKPDASSVTTRVATVNDALAMLKG